MNQLFLVVLSLSLSGALLTLALVLARPLTRRFSRRWQYYIWLVVVARLLLPFAPPGSLVDGMFRREAPAPPPVTIPVEDAFPGGFVPEDAVPVAETGPSLAGAVRQNIGLIWLVVALLLAVRKVTRYQSFLRYIRAGRWEVSDPALLDRLARLGTELGVKRPVELEVAPLLSSPMLVGLLRPRILLPGPPDQGFDWTVRHELIHCRRWDIACKWLVQLAVCVHWFDPLVWWMAREAGRACELACDEAALRSLGPDQRRAYGDALLRAAGPGAEGEPMGAISLNHDGRLLKERLEAIMKDTIPKGPVTALSVAMAVMILAGGTVAGAYTGPAKEAPGLSLSPAPRTEAEAPREGASTGGRDLAAQAERFYQAGSIPLFHSVFPRLDRGDQEAWLEKLYNDGDLAFFAGSVKGLREGDPLIASYGERAYRDDDIVFFSTIADSMDRTALADWLDQALEDKKASFQSVLYQRLGKEEEKDQLEKELEERQMAQYQALGLTREGRSWYYQGQLVHIFLDARRDSSFYRLDIDPLGTVSVEVLRDEENNITGVSVMTQEAVDRWHQDWGWDIQDQWQEAQDQLEEAQARLEEAQARLDALQP